MRQYLNGKIIVDLSYAQIFYILLTIYFMRCYFSLLLLPLFQLFLLSICVVGLFFDSLVNSMCLCVCVCVFNVWLISSWRYSLFVALSNSTCNTNSMKSLCMKYKFHILELQSGSYFEHFESSLFCVTLLFIPFFLFCFSVSSSCQANFILEIIFY